MKEKTKKIFAGIGLGLTLASCGLLAGCSSDITFNQKDLDNLMNNANVYLENQNEYSTEIAKSMFNSLFENFIIESANFNSYKETTNQTNIDIFGNEIGFCAEEITSYFDEEQNLTKQKMTYNDSSLTETLNGYREIVYDDTAVAEEKYVVTTFDIENNSKKVEKAVNWSSFRDFKLTYFVGESERSFGKEIVTPSMRVQEIYNNYDMENIEQISMQKLGSNEYKFVCSLESGSDESFKMNNNFEVVFKEGKLSSIHLYAVQFYEGTIEFSAIGDMKFEWNIENFVVDTSACVEVGA